MGNAQSRQQRNAQRRPGADNDGSDHSQSPVQNAAAAASSASAQNDAERRRNKRRRDSASPAPLTPPTAEDQPRSQRQRTSLHSSHASRTSSPDTSATPQTQPNSTQLADDAMDIDTADALLPPINPPATVASRLQYSAAQSDLQQRFEAVQSSDNATSGIGSGSTPPPHLDTMREERERARRQIFEHLGIPIPANSTAGTAASDSVPAQPDPTPSNSAAAPTPARSALGPPPPSATMLALLGAMATARAATDAAPSRPRPSSSTPAAADDSAATRSTAPSPPGDQQQQQQRPSTAQPQPIRVPLAPEMISGTSMVVQGALVARTVPNRSAPSNAPTTPASSHSPTHHANASESSTGASTTATSSPTAHTASADAENTPGVADPSLHGGDPRGAVTLEEQAVMLSRILGIAAAATAASLLNTSESHHVDPSLLQTSLRRPFERMSQAPSNRDERWLADWQQRPRSAIPNPDSNATQARPATLLDFGSGVRDRFAAMLSRRASSSSAAGASAAPSNPDEAEASRQQEIIARLLAAAEREETSRQADSHRLSRTQTAEPSSTPATRVQASRARSLSSSSPQPTSTTQQDSSRSGLSRLVRSTIGSFMHPSRLLHAGSSRSSDAHSTGSSRDGWSSASSNTSVSNSDSASSDFSLGPNDVAGTLRQVRNGILPDGVPGSFGSFLNHLVQDLMAAVQLMQPSSQVPLEQAEAQTTNYFENAVPGQATSGAEVLDGDAAVPSAPSNNGDDGSQTQNQPAAATAPSTPQDEDVETQARRDRDFQNGNLSFFRLFRFDPVAPSQLVPCIVVGVRSLNVTERFSEEMTGARVPGPGRDLNGSRQQTLRPTTLGSAGPTAEFARQRARSEGVPSSTPGADTSTEANGEELPASRFMLFVSGGRYPPNHPLLTSNPATAGRDLMILMDLLSTMQAMQHKPSTVTQQEIDASNLRKIKGSEVAALVLEGKITENMAERCLVCLEDWKDDDDCRVLACRHAFHTICVDRWMSSSSNTCPMCRRQGVAKDGRQAGEETPDSRRAAQA